MPRSARKKSSTGIYHVVIKGADRQLLFEEIKDCQKYLDILEYYKEECDFELFAYCLMSNHVHLLIRTNDIQISSIFRRINTTYAGWFNLKYDRTGFVQDGRFYSEPVEDEKYLLTVIKYIHYNPTKAGLENFPGEKYVWSSFNDYFTPNPRLVNKDYILNILCGIKNYTALHQTDSNIECLDINTVRKRIPDDVARDIIEENCHCKTVTEFQNLSIVKRNKAICVLKSKGLSIRQINRLTGISRGVINKVLAK